MTRAKKARSAFSGGHGRVPRKPRPSEGVVATMSVKDGKRGLDMVWYERTRNGVARRGTRRIWVLYRNLARKTVRFGTVLYRTVRYYACHIKVKEISFPRRDQLLLLYIFFSGIFFFEA